MTLLVYDVIVVAILRLARFAMRLSGIGLWPGIVLHAGLAGVVLAVPDGKGMCTSE